MQTYQALMLGHAVSILGDGFHSVARGLWVLQTTGSAKAMGMLFVTRILVTVLFSPLGGTLADRVDRRRGATLAVSNSLMMIALRSEVSPDFEASCRRERAWTRTDSCGPPTVTSAR